MGIGNNENKKEAIKLKIPEKVIDIKCGYYHSFFVGESGKVYTTGLNANGQLSK